MIEYNNKEGNNPQAVSDFLRALWNMVEADKSFEVTITLNDLHKLTVCDNADLVDGLDITLKTAYEIL